MSNPDPEVQDLVTRKRAVREDLVQCLRAAKPLPVQLKIALESRDRAVKRAAAAAQEVDALEELLAMRRAAAAEATVEAADAQSEYARLAAATQEEAGVPLINSVPQEPVSIASAAMAFAAILPAGVAPAFKLWYDTLVTSPSEQLEDAHSQSLGDAEDEAMDAAVPPNQPSPTEASSPTWAPFRVPSRLRSDPYPISPTQPYVHLSQQH